MSLSLMASASQDVLLIACGALAGALLVRGIRRPIAADGKLLASLAVALSLVATARPPFGALALLPLGLPRRLQLWRRMLVALVVVICTLSWARIAAVTSLTNFWRCCRRRSGGANPTNPSPALIWLSKR